MAGTLGPYAEGFATWRRILGSVSQEAQLKVFGNAVEEVAGFVARGLDRVAAADELADMATSIGFDDADQLQYVIAHAFERVVEPEGPDRIWDDAPARSAPANDRLNGRHASKYDAPDPSMIPRRAWLFGNHYIRQTCSATVAPGGFGKTTLQLYEAVEMVAVGFKVWYLSGEDPRVELDRRIAAHCHEHSVDLKMLGGQLFVDDAASFPMFIAKARNGAVSFDERSLDDFEQAIIADRIDAVIIDPFISFHGVPENDNNSIDAVVKRLAAIAQRTNCAIELSHHVRKSMRGQNFSLTIDDARGGSAIINAVRSGRIINRMNNDEAERAKIPSEQKDSYVRVDIGKANMRPPDKAKWFRLIGVHLPNGDFVQALVPWKFPGLMDELSVEDTEAIRELVRSRSFRADSRSDNWLGVEVAKRLKLNPEVKADILKIQRIIGVWLRNGVFKKKEMRDPDSRKMRIYFVGADMQAPPPDSNVTSIFVEPEDDD